MLSNRPRLRALLERVAQGLRDLWEFFTPAMVFVLGVVVGCLVTAHILMTLVLEHLT